VTRTRFVRVQFRRQVVNQQDAGVAGMAPVQFRLRQHQGDHQQLLLAARQRLRRRLPGNARDEVGPVAVRGRV